MTTTTTKRTVAVIGGGVSGLAAAWHLKVNCPNSIDEVHIYEANDRLGGHAWTVPVPVPDNKDGGNTIDVDIGFMVFNHLNYPNMVQWFKQLNVQEENSDMSFSVSLDDGQTVEWSSCGLNSLFANRKQMFSYTFYQFIHDMIRFNETATDLLLLNDDDPRKQITTRQYLSMNQYSTSFAIYYLLPMMAALWSASINDVLQFPAVQLISFLCNHQMLRINNRPQWKTVSCRSKSYTDQVYTVLGGKDYVHLSSRVKQIETIATDGSTKKKYKLSIEPTNSSTETSILHHRDLLFDDIIFACHPPTTVDILKQSTITAMTDGSSNNITTERIIQLLKDIEYANNVIYVHSDSKLMPVSKRSWASWNCLGKSQYLKQSIEKTMKTTTKNDGVKTNGAFEGAASGFGNRLSNHNNNYKNSNGDDDNEQQQMLEGENGRFKAVYITYWLNRLQNLRTTTNIFVSLNPHIRPDPKRTYHRVIMAHPQFTVQTLQARKELIQHYQGHDGLWFCGAWTGYGFHEDGCRSGFDVATQLSNVPVPWVVDDTSSNHNNSISTSRGVGSSAAAVVPTLSHTSSSTSSSKKTMVLPPPDLSKSALTTTTYYNPFGLIRKWFRQLHSTVTYDLPIAICKRFIVQFLRQAITNGQLILKYNDGSMDTFGSPSTSTRTLVRNGSTDDSFCSYCDSSPVVVRIFEPWFFVKTALEYDLGLARSYMSGYYIVEPLDDSNKYHPSLRPPPSSQSKDDETTTILGDPIGLTRLFLLFINNRERSLRTKYGPMKSAYSYSYSNPLSNASGLLLSKIGTFVNYIRYKLTMDNSERGGSLRNIHSHYDLSNDLFRTFLDKVTLMYSSAIYDAIYAPSLSSSSTTTTTTTPAAASLYNTPTSNGGSSGGGGRLVFRGTLEEAQVRKLDTLLSRAQIQYGQTLLDIGFGWGGLCIHAAKKYNCTVVGITLSVEQKALAEERVKQEGLQHLITFHVIDYRTFARMKHNQHQFDRVISCEMIEAVGHNHLGEFFWCIEQVLKPTNGIFVMEAITTPEIRYEISKRTTDFINTIIFPGSCCPSLHALIDAAYYHSSLTLQHIDNIGLHYAQTLAEWRRRFNANTSIVQDQLQFDDIFLRVWNYYLTYCEAGFFSQTMNCLILVFARQSGNTACQSLQCFNETRSVTQPTPFTPTEISSWYNDNIV